MDDIIIARNAKKKNINEIAKKLNIDDDYIEQYGKYKAKIDLKFWEKIKNNDVDIVIGTHALLLQ